MSAPERETNWDRLRSTFDEIAHAALESANGRVRYQLWSYLELALLFGDPADWKCYGWIRGMIVGDGRIRLIDEHRLWWAADLQDHAGIMFTADPEIGINWLFSRKAEGWFRDCQLLITATSRAARLRPSRKLYFRDLQKVAKKGMGEAIKAKKQIGNHSTELLTEPAA